MSMTTELQAVESSPPGQTLTSTVASFIAATDARRLPADVLEAMKWLLLDGVANTIAGADNGIARLQADLFETWGGSPQASVLGTRLRTSTPNAAYLNAAFANILDFDDT